MRIKTNRKYTTQILTTILFMILPLTAVNATDNPKVQRQSSKAPTETSQFGQLVGNWKVRQYGLDQNGKWQEGSSADWNFYWILGGTAIQDDWISPSLTKPASEKGRQFGTNIRIYNPKEKRWDLAWASNTGGKVDTFTATADKKNVVMLGIYGGVETRITFYDISKEHFSWKMERQDKEKPLWKEVYRIEAERVSL